MDAFAAAYVSATAVLVAAELYAVIRRNGQGDSITEKIKASRLLHSAMVSLLTWSLVHFTVDPPGVAENVAVAAAGGALGYGFARR